ncbi:hypothetical protein VB620_02595 [Nodularia harveyana UHCC-0300]|uniref:Uncharacterized protein n=1 Tax=Nodularia harveyana UHCC-0300 TaxID=2974287 RepID=A0ABU5U9L6_9CYAN|nr:hypothetical protein [Nodularia harveyana]MEA5580225.1 hypothetical protein [Nodularia harveyana UHCC-0300]
MFFLFSIYSTLTFKLYKNEWRTLKIEDYQHLIEGKCEAVQELFNDIVFPEFIKQTLEEDFEKVLSPRQVKNIFIVQF